MDNKNIKMTEVTRTAREVENGFCEIGFDSKSIWETP